VFYEAPHRIVECVADLCAVLGGERQIVLAREITKLFETIHACPLSDAEAWLQSDSNNQRGEFVVLVSGAMPRAGLVRRDAQHTVEVARRIAAQTGGATRRKDHRSQPQRAVSAGAANQKPRLIWGYRHEKFYFQTTV